MIDKKQRILNLLKKEGKLVSTTKVAVKVGSNYWMTEKYLGALEEENKVKRTRQLNSTYWELSKGEKKDE